MRIINLLILVLLIFPLFVFAHCPLCTAGAGIGALIAKQLGMKSSAIGVWLGAFSVALGWWLGNIVSSRLGSLNAPVNSPSLFPSARPPKPHSPQLGIRQSPPPERASGNTGGFARQIRSLIISEKLKGKLKNQILKLLLILISFLSIILPLKLYFYEIGSFSIFWFGDYGSLFNRTYAYDKFFVGSVIGGLIILISPLISKKMIQLRQGKIFPYQGLIITFILLIFVSILFQFNF